MISEDQKQTIVKRMQEVFPGSTPRVNAKAGGGAYGITTVVPSIAGDNYKHLGGLIDDTETNLTLKRSGTGISILIN
jgi:hypothetical protein